MVNLVCFDLYKSHLEESINLYSRHWRETEVFYFLISVLIIRISLSKEILDVYKFKSSLQLMMSREVTRMYCILDVVCFAIVGLANLLLKVTNIQPAQRGFHCNDDSLRYPFREETISTLTALLVGLGLGLTTVLNNSLLIYNNCCLFVFTMTPLWRDFCRSFM